MTEALFSNIDESCEVLKLDFSSGEFAAFCEKNAFSPETIRGIELFVYCRIEMHKVADQNVTMLQTDKVTKLQT